MEKDAADHEAWFRHQVQIGIDAANAGDLISAEEIEAEAAIWREAALTLHRPGAAKPTKKICT